MPGSPLDRHAASPSELKERLEADRAGRPYLLYRDADDRQVIRRLDEGRDQLSVGRSPSTDIALSWDGGVSWTHAELKRIGDEWVIVDDGLSSNGTFVDGARIRGRHRLEHDNAIAVGSTLVVFRAPRAANIPSATERRGTSTRPGGPPSLSEAQRRVLVALCRPYGETRRSFFTATNRQIAEELHLSVTTVKNHHLRALFELFEIDNLPQSQKRAQLMQRAFATGAVTFNDYRR